MQSSGSSSISVFQFIQCIFQVIQNCCKYTKICITGTNIFLSIFCSLTRSYYLSSFSLFYFIFKLITQDNIIFSSIYLKLDVIPWLRCSNPSISQIILYFAFYGQFFSCAYTIGHNCQITLSIGLPFYSVIFALVFFLS